MKRCVPALLVLLLATPFAVAGERVVYGPVPPELAATVPDERDDALARTALAAFERNAADTDAARSLLVLLDDVGLKAVAQRLAGGNLEARALMDLLTVVAASEHPEADVLLERAADEARPVLRMIVADGLGRGRTARAVPVLARLAKDPVPAVRIAALRSLFAIESPQATAARIAVPADREDELLAARLRWHRRCEDAAPALRAIAEDAYLHKRTVPLRMAAADYLTLPRAETPRPVLTLILRELGQGPLLATAVRAVRGAPLEGYDAVAERRIAIRALFELLARPALSAAERARWIDQAVAWVAHPVAMDPYRRDPIPEHVLRRRLPDLGPEIVAPIVRRLERGGFAEPRQGVILLRELGAEIALPPLRAFLAPRAATPPFESRAEAEQRRYLRNAAAGAVQELGRLGDEVLARALLTGDESKPLKIDILHALVQEDGAWVVPLLADVMHGEDADLRSHAISILERRPEPEARTLLVEDLFERMERPHDRLRPLVERGDEPAFEVLERALQDSRSYLRKAALSQFNRRRNPGLMNEAARTLLAAHVPDAKSSQEIQDYVYALLSVAPLSAVAWVRQHWDELPTDGMRMTTLRILGEAWSKAARTAAIDLALEKSAGQAPKAMKLAAAAVLTGPRDDMSDDQYGRSYRPKEVGAFWWSLLYADDAQLQREAVHAFTHPAAPAEPTRLLTLLRRALEEKALPEDASTPEGEQAFARELIDALRYQPWEAVEGALIDAALAPMGERETRVHAAHMLMGKLSEGGRQRLIDWLAYTRPPAEPADGTRVAAPGVHAGGILQLFLAAAIGEGADDTTAALLFDALERELLGFYTPQRLQALLQGAADFDESQLWSRAVPLARSIGRTQHVPSILAMLDLVFDLRFALYARVCADQQAEFALAAGAGAAARMPSRLSDLTHDDGGANFGMPLALHDILYEVKMLDDDVLAEGYRRVLEKARRDGRLAHFPPLFMYRVHWNLLDPHTGRKPKAADVVLGYARRIGHPDGPMHLHLHRRSAGELADAGRFAEAADAQRHLVRLIARGSHDDREPGLWVYQRAVLDALEGAAAAQRGEKEVADAHFLRAVLRAPNDPDVLNIAAWYRASAGFALEEAEREARRATLLEARVENRPTPNAADTLAYVLLREGKPREGLAVLRPRMRERGAYDNGLLHYHMAQMYAATRMLRSARDALVEALVWDRHLAGQAADEVLFKPLFEKQSFEAVQKLAAEERVRQELP